MEISTAAQRRKGPAGTLAGAALWEPVPRGPNLLTGMGTTEGFLGFHVLGQTEMSQEKHKVL